VKIDRAILPQHPNIHYLGQKAYSELPAYIAGWDVAMLPFALNDSTRFISPTKTPEYLAAGRPVVSTPIRDVVRPYGEMNLVYIARTPEEFVACIEAALAGGDDPLWAERRDEFLAHTSWDKTWQGMAELVYSAVETRRLPRLKAV
jgi:glycosyltransferase involved in cell wall biosynthesis